jgi:5-methylcytosine-specific restriction endonuclease McrA
MPKKPSIPWWFDKAKAMRESGASYNQIGFDVGVDPARVRRELNPEQLAMHKKTKKNWYSANRDDQVAKCAERKADHGDQWGKEKAEETDEELIARIVEWQAKHYFDTSLYNERRRSKTLKITSETEEAAIKAIFALAKSKKKVRCYLCGDLIPLGDREVDHIYPVSKDGTGYAYNLFITHTRCNRIKHAKLPEDLGLLGFK